MADTEIGSATATVAAYTDLVPISRPGDSTARHSTIANVGLAISGVVNVKHHGATGDGTTDDTAAIQAAIDSVEALSGGVVWFPNGTYNVTTLTVDTEDLILRGSSEGATFIKGTGTTGNVIDVTVNTTGIEDLEVSASATRTAVSATAYNDNTPTAGKHGIAFIPSVSAYTQYKCWVRNVTIREQPDDGLIAEQPEMMRLESVDCMTNGRYGIHLNGYTNSKGISNLLYNCRVHNNADIGFYLRKISQSTLIHPQALLGGGSEGIYISEGNLNTIISPDIEDDSSNANTGLKIVGARHKLYGGYIQSYKTPIFLSSATLTTVLYPWIENTGYTAADQAIKLDSASNDNYIQIGPVGSQSNVTALYSIHGSAVGNTVIGDNDIVALAANDTTPSVLGGNMWKTANTEAKLIAMFDDGYAGQRITVLIADGDTTIDFTGTNLEGNAGVDWVPDSGDWLEGWFDGTNWYCAVHDCTA